MTLFMAVVTGILMFAAALVVDVGMQRVARADLQAVADVVALDLSRELDGRTVAEVTPALDAAALRSRRRNKDVLGTGDVRLRVEVGDVTLTGGFARVQSGVPTAVRVVASTDVPFAFAGVTGADSGTATRSAVANAVRSACYTVGSYAAAVSSGSSALLDPLLDKLAEQTGAFSNGYAVGQAIGYQGLASASAELGPVATSLGLASVKDLAAATVSLGRFYNAVKAAIGPGNAAAVQMLGVMASSANAGRSINVGQLLGIDSGSGSLAALRANVLDLVLGSLYVVNGTNGVDLYLNNVLGRLGYLGVKVKAIQGPHLYCGRPGSRFTTGSAAQTEQLNVTGQGTLNPVTVTTTLDVIPGLTLAPATLSAPMWSTMPFSLSVAATETTMTGVRCGASSGIDLTVANRLANLTLTDVQFSEASFTSTIKLLGTNVSVAIVVGNANASSIQVALGATGTVPFSIDVPPKAYDTPYPTQAGGLTATATLKAGVSVRISPTVSLPLLGLYAGADVGLLVSTADRLRIAQAVVDRVVAVAFDRTDANSLTNKVFLPLLSLTGVKLGGSDVSLNAQPPMDCGSPRLRG
ncbi:pilus assembly protein TadG-related protein [Nocardioides sp. LML1-1-1.1]|uniref:pilus assembly protein TadG-related protein n=1 Tax=Nocardioides sp. LML1-1-1.1 TaxID=3135248 RepID=UPI0034407750